MGGGGGTSQNYDAGNLFARVAREQWDLSKEMGDPLYSQMRGNLKGATMPQALQFADKSASQAYDTQRAGLGLDMARRGITMTPDEQTASNRAFGLSEASTRAGMRNAARMHVKDRDSALVLGGMTAGRAPSPATMSGMK